MYDYVVQFVVLILDVGTCDCKSDLLSERDQSLLSDSAFWCTIRATNRVHRIANEERPLSKIDQFYREVT